MDRGRVRGILAAVAIAPGVALAAQGTPVTTSVPSHPVAGEACSGPRVQIDSDTGRRWCCVASQWRACTEDSAATVTAIGSRTPRALADVAADVDPIRRTAVPSTQGRPFSTTHTVLKVTDDGDRARALRTRPDTESKRIVIYGSSMAQGVGASTYASSWAGRFESVMQARGYWTKNVSISGNNSQNLIDRFYTDVAPLHPDFVILCNAIWNDGLGTKDPEEKLSRALRFKANAHRLMKMVEGIGAIPIVMGPYPNANWTPDDVKIIRAIYDEWDRLGVQLWDFWHPNNDGTGRWLPGLSHDGLHINDTGHLHLFESIPLTYFDVAYTKHATEWKAGGGSLRFASHLAPGAADGITTGVTTAEAAAPLRIVFDRPLYDWTVAAWVKDASLTGRTFVALDGPGFSANGAVRVRNTSGAFELVQHSGLMSNVRATGREWHHIAVSYQHQTNTARFYVDGVAIGALTDLGSPSGTPSTLTGIAFLGRHDSGQFNASGAEIAEPLVYRSNLDGDDIREIYSGRVVRKSLEYWGSAANPPGRMMPNLADTATRGELNRFAAWDWNTSFEPSHAGQIEANGGWRRLTVRKVAPHEPVGSPHDTCANASGCWTVDGVWIANVPPGAKRQCFALLTTSPFVELDGAMLRTVTAFSVSGRASGTATLGYAPASDDVVRSGLVLASAGSTYPANGVPASRKAIPDSKPIQLCLTLSGMNLEALTSAGALDVYLRTPVLPGRFGAWGSVQ